MEYCRRLAHGWRDAVSKVRYLTNRQWVDLFSHKKKRTLTEGGETLTIVAVISIKDGQEDLAKRRIEDGPFQVKHTSYIPNN